MIAQGVPRKIKIAAKVAMLVPAFLIGLPAQWLSLKLAPPISRWMPVYFHRYVLFVMGVKVTRIGAPEPGRPVLIVSNHLSWLDILVISSLFPVSFIAKSEVGEWPLFGTLARLQRSIFVERQRRGKTGEVNKRIASRLNDGDALVLFAEGTTSDGTRVLPFRSALIGAAQAATGVSGTNSYLQPLNIAYPRIGGLPTGRVNHPHLGWYGDMDLLPHLSDFLTLPNVDCQVTLLPAHAVTARTDRKALTRQIEAEIRASHAAALTGRSSPSSENAAKLA
jgi:lyso-ornithine lipid O-acyltransferase